MIYDFAFCDPYHVLYARLLCCPEKKNKKEKSNLPKEHTLIKQQEAEQKTKINVFKTLKSDHVRYGNNYNKNITGEDNIR